LIHITEYDNILVMAHLEDRYSRFQRDYNIDLPAEIAAGGSDDGLANYYNKSEIDTALDTKVDTTTYTTAVTSLDSRLSDVENNPSAPDLTNYYTKSQIDNTVTNITDSLDSKVDAADLETLDSRVDVLEQSSGPDLTAYYNKTETNSLLAAKADDTDITGLDSRVTDLETAPGPDLSGYYTKTATDSLLDDKSDVGHNHTGVYAPLAHNHDTAYSALGHLHDDRYYTESETDTLLSSKANSTALTAHIDNTSNPHATTKAQVGLANVDNTSDVNKPVSSATQTALNAKAPLASPAFTGTPTGITKTHVGLGNVDNTSDANKPVSTATQSALDAKAPLASPAFTGTPTGITKSHVGLGNVDNTSDANKPVSTATQTALNAKAPLASPAFTGTPTGITKTHVGLGNVDNTADTAKPISTLQQAALDALDLRLDDIEGSGFSGGAGTFRTAKPSMLYSGAINHSAFPGICMLPNRTLFMTWREGTNHVGARDGSIRYATSTNFGRTWSAAGTIVANAGGGIDLRDPSVSYIDGKIYLTYFTGTAVTAATGAFVRTSTDGTTWTSAVRIDNLPYAAICSPIVKIGTTLYAFYYGRSGVETIDSVWYSTSTNEGVTWTAATRLVNGPTGGLDFQEPCAVVNGTNALVLFRYGTNANIGSISYNGSTWGSATSKFAGSGRPSAIYTSTGDLLVSYRSLTGGFNLLRASKDFGSTYYPARTVDVPPDGGMMTYTAFCEVKNGLVIMPYTEENAAGNVSKLLLTYVNQGGGQTPLGEIPNDAIAVANHYDNIVLSTSFSQSDSTLPYPLVTNAGAFTVTDGVLNSASADNTPDFATVNTGSLSHYVEADFLWTVQSGFAVVFRLTDSNNYLMMTSETSGANLRLYKVSSGSATQLAVNTNYKTYTGFWSTFRLWIQGKLITASIGEGVPLFYELTDPEQAAFTGRNAGVKLNAQSSGINSCRRLIVKTL
jgi:hypothetical protein